MDMRKLWVCSLSGVLFAMLAAPLWAQSTGLELEEIVVTATKRDTDLQKTDVSIQVYQAEDLKREGKKRIDEIMSGTVGVQVQDGPQGATFFMRGINGTPFGPDIGGTSPAQSTVAVLIDGVYQSRSETVRGGTLDMKQVEVMRGTQSTTVGANALIGAVSLVSNQPAFEYQASGSLEVGNYHLLSTQGVLNVPLSDSQALRIAYASNKRDGYASSGAGDSDLTNARLKYRWQLSDQINTVVTLEHQIIGGNGVTQSALAYQGYWEPYVSTHTYDWLSGGAPTMFGHVNNTTTYLQRSNPWNDGYPKDAWQNNPFYNSNVDTLSLNLDWNLGFATLSAIPSYQRTHYQTTEPAYRSPIVHFDQKQQQSQVDLRLASPSGGKIEWLAGIYSSLNTRSGPVASQLYPGLADSMGTVACDARTNTFCWGWTDTKQASTRSNSAYLNLTYAPIDTLRVNGSLRYTKDVKQFTSSARTDFQFCTVTTTPCPLANLVILGSPWGPTPIASDPNSNYVYANTGKGTWNKTTYRGGVEYDILPTAMAYATYSTGYQAGNAQQAMGGTISPYVCDRAINATCTLPLLLKQFTLGLKTRWFNNKLQANVEAFDTRYTNQPQTVSAYVNRDGSSRLQTGACALTAGSTDPAVIVPASATNPTAYSCIPTYPTTTNQVKSRGADLELNFLPTENDRIDTSIEYIQSEMSAVKTAPPSQAALVGFGLSAVEAAALLNQYALNAQYFEGYPQQNSPKWSFNTSYAHTFRLGQAGTLTPKVNWIKKSEYWTSGFGGIAPSPAASSTFLDPATQKSYNLYNAYLTWQTNDGKFSVDGYFKNIENTPVLVNYNNGGPLGFQNVSLDAPRTYGVVFSASF